MICRKKEESFMLERYQMTTLKDSCDGDLNVLEKLKKSVFISEREGKWKSTESTFDVGRQCHR